MSGSSYEATCPRCGKEMDCYADWKPYDITSGECLNCGFEYHTEEGQLTLEEVNERRADRDEPPVEIELKGADDDKPNPATVT